MLGGADVSNRILGSATHRYLLTPPWSEERVRTFEKRHGIGLPLDYRHFLTKIGSAGAGPAYGLLEPGTWDDQPRRWEGTQHVAPLSTPFPHTRTWNLSREHLAALNAEADDDHAGVEYWSPEVTAGAMPLAALGNGVRLLLVITGGERGRIWIDDRVNYNGLAPEAGLDFERWYQLWLDGTEQLLMAPPKRRTTGRRNTRPGHTVPLEGVAAAAATRLRDKVYASLAAGRSLDVGGLGRFVAGPHPHFEQGQELRDAIVVRSPPHGPGDAHTVFAAVFERVATGAAVEVPGLFSAWRAAAAVWEFHDYLGRRKVAEEPALLVIADDPGLPKSA